ncbi:MAG: hypothetical protein ABI270_05405 [Nitrosospira sp.]
MVKFVFYLRTEEGHIKRLENMTVIGTMDFLSSYQYPQPLSGFPEPAVFWAKEKGLSTGITVIDM